MKFGFPALKVDLGDPSRWKLSDVSVLLRAVCSIGKSTYFALGFFFFSFSNSLTLEFRVSLLPFFLS